MNPVAPPAVGRSLARPGDRDLVRGRTPFGADRSPGPHGPPGPPATAVFVRSPYAHARVTGVDSGPAAREPGVLGVYTAADLDLVAPGPFHPSLSSWWVQPLLAAGRVRYQGEPVAVVVAETREAAVDAAESVAVDYEPLTPVLDLDPALAGAGPIHDGTDRTPVRDGDDDPRPEGNVALDTGWVGTLDLVDDDLAGHEIVVSGRQFNPRLTPAPIEGRVVTAWWTDGVGPRLRVWSNTQRPHGYRDELAALYRLAADDIEVDTGPAVGGGFGGKNGRTPEERLIPWLARAVGRPVSWVETRTENLTVAPQGRGERIEMTLAGSADGRIRALRAELVKDVGAYPMTGALLPGGYTVPGASGCYDIAQVAIRCRSVATNRVPTSAYRGAGRAPYIAALERMVDRFAAAAGLDPAEVRRRNLVRPDQHPHHTPTGGRYDEADYPGDLERALTGAGYLELRAEQARRRAEGGPRQLGIGLACYNHLTVGPGGEAASVTLLEGGRFRVVTGSTDQGHGHAVTWAQIAADAVGAPVDRIEVVEGSTALIATGVGAVGSRSAQTAGIAVHRSGHQLVDEARSVAAGVLEAATEDVVFDRGDGGQRGRFHVVGTPAVSVGWAEVAAARADHGRGELACGDHYDPDGAFSYPSGAHVAVVEVDAETGAVAVRAFLAVDDAGVRINPTIVEGQLHGGIAAGIGQALGEVTADDDVGNNLTATLIDYAMATTDVVPPIELIAGGVASSFNELGVKGVGESGPIGATPAVHNAVIDALAPLGLDHVDLPCTPERVWAALRQLQPDETTE